MQITYKVCDQYYLKCLVYVQSKEESKAKVGAWEQE